MMLKKAAAWATGMAMGISAFGAGAAGTEDVYLPNSTTLTPFAVDLYKQVAETGTGNQFYSPLSVAEAFGMLQAGARGDTALELAKAFKVDQDKMPGVIRSINEFLGDKKDRPYALFMANGVWVQNAFPLRAEFEKVVKEQYLSAGYNCDFVGKPNDERKRINEWVLSNTAEKIKDLLPEGSITPLTRLVLTNAIYFKADWAKQFDANKTKEEDFTLASGEKVKAKMMNEKIGGCGYFEGDGVVALSMPYKGGQAGASMSFVAMMPARGSLAEMEKNLTAEGLSKILGQLPGRSEVNVSIPKFKMETKYDLVPLMKKLGVEKVFKEGQADLTGITSSAQGKDLYVSGAFHKTFVDVDEKGTEAAAATGVVVGVRMAMPRQLTFKADKPFLFVIQDVRTHTILFMGRVMDPTK